MPLFAKRLARHTAPNATGSPDQPPTPPALVPASRPEGGPPSPARQPAGRAIWFLVLIGAALGLWIHQAMPTGGEAVAATTTASLEVHVAEKRDFVRTLRVGGTVGATNFAMIRAPRMRGRGSRGGAPLTIETLVEPGSMVQKGDVLAVFEARRTEEILDRYESDLVQSRARATSRKANILASTESLRQRYVAARAEAEKAKLNLRTAPVRSVIQAEILELQAQQAEASFRQLEREVRLQEAADTAEERSLEIAMEQDRMRVERTLIDFERMSVRAPVSGLAVVETMYQRGSFSQASAGDPVNAGSPLLRVVDLSKMAVFADLNQVDGNSIGIGARAEIRLDAFPDVVFEGRVASVGAVAAAGGGGSTGGRRSPGSQGSRGEWVKQIPVIVEVLNADQRIVPDLSASVDIVLEERKDAVVIPRAALAHSPGGPTVWVQGRDGFAERAVQVGPFSDTEAIVQSGLQPGEAVAGKPVPANLRTGEAGV